MSIISGPIVLKEENFKSNIFELKRRGYIYFLFVQIGNKRGFIVSKDAYKIEILYNKSSFPAILKVNEKVPLYKQSMEMSMGKVPKATKESLHSYTVRVLDKYQENYFYTIWSIA